MHASGRKAFLAGVTVAGAEPGNCLRAAGAGVDAILTDESLALAATLRSARTKP